MRARISVAVLLAATIGIFSIVPGSVHGSADGKMPQKPRFALSAIPFTGEGYDLRPVAVVSVGTQKDKTGERPIQYIGLHNSSNKDVQAVKLAWTVKENEQQDAVLQGETVLIGLPKQLEPQGYASLTYKLTTFSSLREQLRKLRTEGGDFVVEVSAVDVNFVDGTSWNVNTGYAVQDVRNVPGSEARFIRVAFSRAAPLPLLVTPLAVLQGCPKQQCSEVEDPLGNFWRCDGASGNIFCTNCVTSCCVTICGQQPTCGSCS